MAPDETPLASIYPDLPRDPQPSRSEFYPNVQLSRVEEALVREMAANGCLRRAGPNQLGQPCPCCLHDLLCETRPTEDCCPRHRPIVREILAVLLVLGQIWIARAAAVPAVPAKLAA